VAISLVVLSLVILFRPGTFADSGYPNIRNPFGIDGLSGLFKILEFALLLVPVSVVGSVVSLVMRFRRASGIERQQMNWIVAAAAIVGATFPIALIATTTVGTPGHYPALVVMLQNVSLFSLALIPASAGIAILRYRLYDIDVIVNRTIVYATLTFLLGLTYLGLVVLLQQILNPVTHQSDIAVAGSTLVVAALFRPLRERVQAFIDRRFYRHKYDVTQTLEDFSHILRNEVDLPSIRTDLLGVVGTTMQPVHASLWLRDPGAA
jgi:hypothetical protein